MFIVYLISEFDTKKMYVGTNVMKKSVSHVMSMCPVEESILSLSVLQPPLCCAGSPCVGWTSQNLSYLTYVTSFNVRSVIIMFEFVLLLLRNIPFDGFLSKTVDSHRKHQHTFYH